MLHLPTSATTTTAATTSRTSLPQSFSIHPVPSRRCRLLPVESVPQGRLLLPGPCGPAYSLLLLGYAMEEEFLSGAATRVRRYLRLDTYSFGALVAGVPGDVAYLMHSAATLHFIWSFRPFSHFLGLASRGPEAETRGHLG